MLWEVEILPAVTEFDHEGQRVLDDARNLGIQGLSAVQSARSFLVQGDISESQITETAPGLLYDRVVEQMKVTALPNTSIQNNSGCINVLLHPGVTDSIARNAADALIRRSLNVTAVATCRKYRLSGELSEGDRSQLVSRVLANDAIEYVLEGPLQLTDLSVGSRYDFQKVCVAIRDMDDSALERLSGEGQLYLSLVEMQTIQNHFRSLDRDPTDIELETIAQTWSEHCSHKTLGGRIHYREHACGETLREVRFDNMLQETIFLATQQIRERLGDDDWCVSVFRDNAGVVEFDDRQSVCFKVETHNHPSAIEPYGGANTGLGGVIRDPMGTGLGARPVCSTDVFCFARPDFSADELPPGILHPRAVMQGVIAGVRDYGNRMGIPTVN
ncbi:MAG: AIR synthase related protein, partial [Fuerstiella sp.]|nr:AIR synthase related protein [Fuerstiella sp.]